jgi:hypothetical protein
MRTTRLVASRRMRRGSSPSLIEAHIIPRDHPLRDAKTGLVESADDQT